MEIKIRCMLAAMDRGDLDAFGSFLAEDVRLVFANGEPIQGRTNVVAAVGAILQSLHTIAHTLDRFWQVGDVVIIEGQVRYLDGLDQTLDARYADVLELNAEGQIIDYRVYVDASALNQPRLAQAAGPVANHEEAQ